jgi:uncharacterized surface anchored protein
MDAPHVIEGIPVGRYVLHEASSPAGFTTAPDALFEVADSADVQAFSMSDVPTEASFAKLDAATGRPLAGAALQVFADDGDGRASGVPLYEWTSEEAPHVVIGIPIGAYVLHEVSAPAGYTTTDDVSFRVADSADMQMFSISDTPTETSFSKFDVATSRLLAGATLQVFADGGGGRPTGDVLYEWTSEEAPCVIEGIPTGSYVLHEATAPEGYATALDVPFKVVDVKGPQAFSMSDERIIVSFSKLDICTDKPLAGAALQVFADNGRGRLAGDLLYEWRSGKVPHVIKGIPVGRYILREAEAPEGYVVSDDVLFEVKDTAEAQAVTMYDELAVVPGTWDKTGYGLLLAMIALPVSLLGLALGLCWVRRLALRTWLRRKAHRDGGTDAVGGA